MQLPHLVILDVDGTLVDSNYHHALAWYRGFRQHGVTVPLASLHRHVGMGGDKYVPAVAGEDVEKTKGDAIREARTTEYMGMIGEVAGLEGATEFITYLKKAGHTVVLASSAKQDEVDHYLDLLNVRDVLDGWTASEDVDASKPAPDLVEAALKKGGGGEAVLVGDSVWDCKSAAAAGVETIGVLTGGFAESELREAGAREVFQSVKELLGSLQENVQRS